MKRTLTSAILLSAVTVGANAAQLSPEEALRRAQTDAPAKMAKASAKATPRLAHTATTATGTPAVYVFNNPDNRGYIFLSADDVAAPILGYSDKGTFSTEQMPAQLKWWMEEYARQIEYARANNLPAFTPRRKSAREAERTAIAPQVKTYWDQIAPFNDQCPLSGAERTWTGCVATSMAQVMKYWNYPEKGKGSITYSIESLEKRVTMDFTRKAFEWDEMIPSYVAGNYTDTQAEAVAYLMKAAGYSVKMQYSMDASGALAMNIGNALVKYFDYDPNLLYTLRQYYSTTDWEQMVYENLRDVGPILYGGGSTLGGGHSFVCDGYDGDGMFHFNWGWSGMSDGYFSLDALNPNSLGTGGGAGGGYNFTQDAVFGIQPPTNQPVEERPVFLSQEGELAGNITGLNLNFTLENVDEPIWVNYNPQTLYMKFGAMFYPQGDTPGEPVYRDVYSGLFELQPGYGTNAAAMKPTVRLSSLGLKDGTYKVVIGTCQLAKGETSAADDGTGFVPVKPTYGAPNYVTLNKNGARYTVVNDLLPALKVTGEVIDGLYYGCLNKVKVTVENPSDVERISGFAPVFVDNEGPLLMGESILVSIPPKSTVTREWETDLTQFVQYIDPYLGSQLGFTFFNEETFEFYNDQFLEMETLNANPGLPKVKVQRAFSIEGSTKDGDYLILPDPNNIHVTARLLLEEGVFRYPIVIVLGTPAEGDQMEIQTSASQNMFLSMENLKSRLGDVDLTFSYPLAVPGDEYYIGYTYYSPVGLYPLTNAALVKFADQSGVEEIEPATGITAIRRGNEISISAASSIAEITVYDITGARAEAEISCNATVATVKVTGDGPVILIVTDNLGNRRTFKLR